MASVVSLLLGNVTPLVVGLRATEYMFVACAALWTYDYFITLDREVALVWRSRWSFGKVIFFLNRYFPIIATILANDILQGVKNQGECRSLSAAALWTYQIGFFWSEIILAMRAWAMWGGTRIIFFVLTTFTLVIYIVECVLLNRLVQSAIDIPIPQFLVPILGLTCAPLAKPHNVFWPEFMVFMVNETVLSIMALSRGFQRYRALNNPLIATMFHDGLLYYIYNLALTIANLVVTLTAPIQWVLFLELPLGVLSSIFATRVLLNIRGTYFQPYSTSYTDHGAKSTNLDFQSQHRAPGAAERGSDVETGDIGSSDERDFVVENIDDYEFDEQGRSPSGQGWIWTTDTPPHQNEVELAVVSADK